MDGRRNRRRERDIEHVSIDKEQWGTTEYNITATVRTGEEGGQESSGQGKEGNGGGRNVQKVRRGLQEEFDK